MTHRASTDDDPLPPFRRRRPRVGLVSGGLGTYWPQFPDLLPQLQESARYVAGRFEQLEAEVVDAGFISDAQEGAVAAEALRRADCDLIVLFLTTYLTSSMVLPIAQRSGAPVLVIDLQPTEAMDHANFDTGKWLAYCGQCSVPEIGNVFRRGGIEFRSVSGYLGSERAWARIDRWVRAAGVRSRLRTARHGLMGHLYPGMLDVSTDMTLLPAQLGSHVEVLEFDDLRVRVAGSPMTRCGSASRSPAGSSTSTSRSTLSTWTGPCGSPWAWTSWSTDFDLDSLAYYHRGLEGELHERLGAGMILGASILTARGIPAAGEYELRTSVAMLACQALGAGGSFTEIQALNFVDDVVEMGHDGPAHLAVSARQPLLRGLGVFHGKRGWGVSVEFDVRSGPVTTVGIGQDRDGRLSIVTSEGTVVPGPLLAIGNTTSRVDFGCDPGEWVDAWSASGVGHHWALATGHRTADFAAVASLAGIAHRSVAP